MSHYLYAQLAWHISNCWLTDNSHNILDFLVCFCLLMLLSIEGKEKLAAQLGRFLSYQIVLRCIKFSWFGESVSTEASHSISYTHLVISVKYKVLLWGFFACVLVCSHLHPAENESRSRHFNAIDPLIVPLRRKHESMLRCRNKQGTDRR